MSGNSGFRIVGSLVLTLLLIGAAAALGYMAYNAGVVQGVAQAGSQGAPPAPMPYYGFPFYGFHPFGFGFLGCLVPLIFICLVFSVVRMVFGGFGWRRHGPWGWRDGPWGSDEMRTRFREKAEEWHREMHGEGEAKS